MTTISHGWAVSAKTPPANPGAFSTAIATVATVKDNRLAIPIDEAAALLDVSYNTLWRAVREDQFAGVRIRDRIVIPVDALRELHDTPRPEHSNTSLAIGLRTAATLMGVSYNTLWRASAEDQFPARRIRTRVIVPRSALHALLEAAVTRGLLIDAAVWTFEWRASLAVNNLAA